MSRIKLLPDHIISKIAAGEVIERPAFVVKELIENSLDAHATSIKIEIEESGLKKIQVMDNGDGMNGEDLEEAVKIHTTSKISDELIGISSFGFRGEALASIGAVSVLTIKSRMKKSPSGTQIKVRFGKFESLMPIGLPPGTIVTAENIFAHVPARKKFLKSSKTEFRHIIDIVTRYALAFPSVRFELFHNGKSVIDLIETDDISRRVKFLFGDLIHTSLLPLSKKNSHVKLSGFVGHPQIATSKPTKQYLFVNGRSVTNKVINNAISESFFSILPRDQYP
jgi:DNA mismatch repair protein MutL